MIAQESATTTDPKHLTALLKEGIELLGQRQSVRGLPVWPIGTIGRRILSTGFVFALLPWALKVTYPSLKDLADFLGILLKSLS